MTLKRQFQNLFRNKYFVVFTLLSLFVGLDAGYNGIHSWPESSIQLSSEETDSATEACTSCLGANDKMSVKKGSITSIYEKLTASKEVSSPIEELVKKYETSKEVQKLISVTNKGYVVHFHGKSKRVKNGVESASIRACYRGVKTALLKSGITDGKYLSGISAKSAGKFLEKAGFVNLLKTEYKEKIKTPYDCPKGAVIVYSGGRNGHIEICTGTGFVSDYYSSEPRTGRSMSANRRTVIGVYIKSNSEINNYLASNEKKDAQYEKHN